MHVRLRRLSLGLGLIAVAAAVLLGSDLDNRRHAAPRRIERHVAIVQFASRSTLDQGVRGILAGLAAGGYREGQEIEVKRFNSENDLPTANAMAREATSGRYDLVMSVSTPSLQSVAGANLDARVPHVFSIVTDPAGCGVGVERDSPLAHPPYLCGIGTFQPVTEVFELLKQYYPHVKRVGTVWCPAEECAQACLRQARAACQRLGIKLVEVTVDNTAGVKEATRALCNRGIDAIWIGGDNTVEIVADLVAVEGLAAHVPTVTNNPEFADKGALISLGANYVRVGEEAGKLAARVLDGLPPAQVPIENVVPQRLDLNRNVLTEVPACWAFPAALLARADRVVGDTAP